MEWKVVLDGYGLVEIDLIDQSSYIPEPRHAGWPEAAQKGKACQCICQQSGPLPMYLVCAWP